MLLPDGFYYGNLDPETAISVVRGHLAGEVPAQHLRGMAAHPPPVQAALVDAFARLGPLAPADLTVQHVVQHGPHHEHGSQTTVTVGERGRARLMIRVEAVRCSAAQLTCRAARETPATTYAVVDVTEQR